LCVFAINDDGTDTLSSASSILSTFLDPPLATVTLYAAKKLSLSPFPLNIQCCILLISFIIIIIIIIITIIIGFGTWGFGSKSREFRARDIYPDVESGIKVPLDGESFL